MKSNIDKIVSRYNRLWLEISVNGTLNIVTQSKRKLGIGVILLFTRHIQCQLTFRNIFSLSCIMEKLTTQSLVVKSIQEFVDGRFINQWSNLISHLPRNIFSFTIRYLNNTLANGTNALKWGIIASSTCTFCDQQQTLGHVIGGYETTSLKSRYNWCHDSVLLNI